MPTIKVKTSITTWNQALQRRSNVVRFYWDELPQRGRPCIAWCLRCCIDKLEGRSRGPCCRTTGEADRCFNCLHRMMPCTAVPEGITAYRGDTKFVDESHETYRGHADGDLLAELKVARGNFISDYQDKFEVQEYLNKASEDGEDEEDEESEESEMGVDKNGDGNDTDQGSDPRSDVDGSTSDEFERHYDRNGVARRIPYSPVWGYEQRAKQSQ